MANYVSYTKNAACLIKSLICFTLVLSFLIRVEMVRKKPSKPLDGKMTLFKIEAIFIDDDQNKMAERVVRKTLHLHLWR